MKKLHLICWLGLLLFCTTFSHAQIEFLPTDQDHIPAELRENAEQVSKNTDSYSYGQVPIRVNPSAATDLTHSQVQPYTSYGFPSLPQEKILFFDTHITVQPDAQITVTENITVNVRHQQIRRGIYRDLPLSLSEKATPISLTMDGKQHPFFVENKSNTLRVNFGNDDYITQGVHTYSFTYTFNGAIDFYKNHDELYWNVTGNDWNFPIDKARLSVILPEGVSVQKQGISLYTGYKGAKQHHARQIAPLVFETTQSLQSYEGFTAAIPFNKGFFVKPPLLKRLVSALSLTVLFFVAIFILLLVYFVGTWLKVGRDPALISVTQYEPPQGISATYMQYLHDRQVTSKTLASVLISLAMKGYIEIKPNKSFLSSTKAEIHFLGKKQENLPPDEELVLNRLLGNGVFLLGPSSADKLKKVFEALKKHFEQESKEYIVTNSSYLSFAIILVVILGLLPPLMLKHPELIFINGHFSVFFTAFTFPTRKIRAKIIFATLLTLFYSPFFITTSGLMSPVFLCELLFVSSMWGLSFYASLIENITPHGQEMLAYIAGFEKYMKTAEPNRFAASNPADTERIFCNYLPFAFALGMENKWMKKFEHVLSKSTMEQCTACVGGTKFVSGALASSVSSSGGGGGSHGGGCSGGGHGGGGGGGR